ncbi:MAG: hypothetical protein ACD_30C00112G0013 [uncultured bacterium]|uniref:Lysine--tRNA ligase n=4 Tax=Candidatus Daviesiibacteriota TaxID=1752718 RepID=A0A0G0HTM9_9BACT|nr:MAG: hypothetical protein ACD_30C00112G0013 [uncultured bacterium]KKQ07231.1 MAG: Lysine-tRNA ligase [Candidatus Daviesbacteria bacterium GW2011_GWB1_36_5]KKQ15310.1 MAG: Lysine-tRNA ligase [Candidatus Daviesbacteria bacterium GW2011_GWA1_36_8]OGE17173.1 MAG: lysine--tRNA ligase [Candidatus Daviesbacteria bacterium RIFCSPHIGHO2_01_FULL_36_37]OGE35954.1 MAG: lysine--tRNA ligase [Candidatus Daviesbacteria bacterium RIFCSPHIGHO2_12_FULL_37_16]
MNIKDTELSIQGDYESRLEHARKLEVLGIDPFPAKPFRATHTSQELISQYSLLEGSQVSIAGRLQSKREHGKIIFGHVEDRAGQIQIVMNQRILDGQFPIIKDLYDTGDFVGAKGELKATNRGEISIWAKEMTMLTKALRGAPRKIADAEIMQRQRYLHTLVDPDARDRFRIRSKIVQSMRDYFIDSLGALEVETPVLDTTYGGALAKPFITNHNALDTEMYLRISNELYLKRMTVGGFSEGVFEFSRDFRNEGMDRTHNPEFTQVELYMPFWDYNNMMDMTEDLMSGIARQLHGTTEVPYRMPMGDGKEKEVGIDYKTPWRRVSIYEGIREMLGIDPSNISDSRLRTIAHQYEIDTYTRGDVLVELFEKVWEKDLIQPTFVMDYPADTSALTKRHRTNPDLTERFEIFVAGMEVGNSYSELNDPRDQRTRFETEKLKREHGDKEAMPFDEDFILAMEYGMPQQAGIGISIDRWTMLLTDTNHIRHVIYFPPVRPKQIS